MFIKDLLNELTYVQVNAGGTAITATGVGTAINLAGYVGECVLIFDLPRATAGTNPTITVSLTTCSTSNGSFVALNNAAGTQIATTAVTGTTGSQYQTLTFDTRIAEQYLQLSWTVGGTSSPSFPSLAVSLVASKQVN